MHVLQHTSPQVYSKRDWNDSIMQVPAKIRKSHIAIALDLDLYVLAFVTRDLLFVVSNFLYFILMVAAYTEFLQPIWHTIHTSILIL